MKPDLDIGDLAHDLGQATLDEAIERARQVCAFERRRREGKIEKRHESPLIEWSSFQVMNAVRYQNPGNKPVRIPITVAY